MEIVKPFVKKIDLSNDKKIEYAGRLCYKSADKITENSYEKFITNIIKSGHESVIEHGIIYCILTFQYPLDSEEELSFLSAMMDVKYLVVDYIPVGETCKYIISGNIRAWREFYHYIFGEYEYDSLVRLLEERFPLYFYEYRDVNLESFSDPIENIILCDTYEEFESNIPLMYQCNKPMLEKHRFVTFHYRTDRATSHQLVRHRPCSFSQQSQRYCNYTKEKFGNNIQFIVPIDFPVCNEEAFNLWKEKRKYDEEEYFKNIIVYNMKPEIARNCLPNCASTEIIITASIQQWKRIFKERCNQRAQADIRYLMEETKNQLIIGG